MNRDNFINDDKPSVRVHHAPGGQSSFSLAHDSSYQQNSQKVRQNNNANSSNFSLAWNDSTPSQKVNVPIQQQQVQQQQVKGKNVSQQQGFTVGYQENQVKTSIQVRNPPGGRSQITFG